MTTHKWSLHCYIPLAFLHFTKQTTANISECFYVTVRKVQKANFKFKSKIYCDWFRKKHSVVGMVWSSLGECWFRKIQELDLAAEYSESDVMGKWLNYVFGLSFLSPNEDSDSFVLDLMAILSSNDITDTQVQISLNSTFTGKTCDNVVHHTVTLSHSNNMCLILMANKLIYCKKNLVTVSIQKLMLKLKNIWQKQ